MLVDMIRTFAILMIMFLLLLIIRRTEEVDNEGPQGPNALTSRVPLSRLKDWSARP